jgi:hypothetical protein
MQELAYVPCSNHKAKTLQESDEPSNQQHRNDPLKVMNVAEKKWDQLDTRLARYDQNSEETLLLKLPDKHVWPWTRYVQFRRVYLINELDMSGLPENFLPNFDSSTTGHQNGWNLDTKVTSTQVTSFQWGVFPNRKISLPILNELEEPSFWEKREKSTKSKGLETWIHFKIGGRWWDST